MVPLLTLATSLAMLTGDTSPGPELPTTPGLVEKTFPLIATEEIGQHGLSLVPQLAWIRDLDGESAVRLTDVTVPSPDGVVLLDMELERVNVVPDHAERWVDGKFAGGADVLREGFSAWYGGVSGEADSQVFLAFTKTGTQGWITRRNGTVHVLNVPDAGGDITAWKTAMFHESDPGMPAGGDAFECGTPLLPQVNKTFDDADFSGRIKASTLLEAFLAVETDYQFYQLHNDLTVAQDYIMSLMGAISAQYEAQISVRLSIAYLGLYSNSSDPWSTPESGGSMLDMLDEFQDAWRNNIPLGADLAHFVSGAGLGGGVAYLDVLCDGNSGFAVSGNLHGRTPFPVSTTGSLNWDFIVIAHELGHNFGSQHTHDFCPTPVDQCAPSYAFGFCQSSQVCVLGTIMSYCHLCSGGISNIQTVFDPKPAAIMSLNATTVCFSPAGGPRAQFDGFPRTGDRGVSVDFDFEQGLGTIATSWQWDFGDGSTSTQENPTHAFADSGSYTVTLVVTDASGNSDTEISPGYVTVRDELEITDITPSTIDALIPGTDRTITITGTGFSLASVVELDGVPVTTDSKFVDANTITLDMPEVSALGTHTIGISDDLGSDVFDVTVVAPMTPKLQCGNGDVSNPIYTFDGVDLLLSGLPGELHYVVTSASNVPSVLPGKINLGLGNGFQNYGLLGPYFIGPDALASDNIPLGPVMFLPIFAQSVNIEIPFSDNYPLDVSGLQEFLILF